MSLPTSKYKVNEFTYVEVQGSSWVCYKPLNILWTKMEHYSAIDPKITVLSGKILIYSLLITVYSTWFLREYVKNAYF